MCVGATPGTSECPVARPSKTEPLPGLSVPDGLHNATAATGAVTAPELAPSPVVQPALLWRQSCSGSRSRPIQGSGSGRASWQAAMVPKLASALAPPCRPPSRVSPRALGQVAAPHPPSLAAPCRNPLASNAPSPDSTGTPPRVRPQGARRLHPRPVGDLAGPPRAAKV